MELKCSKKLKNSNLRSRRCALLFIDAGLIDAATITEDPIDFMCSDDYAGTNAIDGSCVTQNGKSWRKTLSEILDDRILCYSSWIVRLSAFGHAGFGDLVNPHAKDSLTLGLTEFYHLGIIDETCLLSHQGILKGFALT